MLPFNTISASRLTSTYLYFNSANLVLILYLYTNLIQNIIVTDAYDV